MRPIELQKTKKMSLCRSTIDREREVQEAMKGEEEDKLINNKNINQAQAQTQEESIEGHLISVEDEQSRNLILSKLPNLNAAIRSTTTSSVDQSNSRASSASLRNLKWRCSKLEICNSKAKNDKKELQQCSKKGKSHSSVESEAN